MEYILFIGISYLLRFLAFFPTTLSYFSLPLISFPYAQEKKQENKGSE